LAVALRKTLQQEPRPSHGNEGPSAPGTCLPVNTPDASGVRTGPRPRVNQQTQAPVHPLADAFIEHLNQLNERWQNSARSACRHFCTWLQEQHRGSDGRPPDPLDLELVTPSTMDAYVQHLAVAYPNQNTRRGKLHAIRRWFRYLHAHGLISRDPCMNLPRIPKQPSRLNRLLSPQQVSAFFQAVLELSPFPERDVALFGCLAALGLRPRELLEMRVDDLDLHGAQLRVLGKGNRERLVPINGTVLLSLERYLAHEAPWMSGDRLWRDRRHPLSMHKLRNLFHRYRQAAGIPGDVGGPHLFRHYFITQNLMSGTDLRDLAAVVGHSNIRSLEAYFHVSNDDLRAVLTSAREEEPSSGVGAKPA
jgi:site-specific recombinase XerD